MENQKKLNKGFAELHKLQDERISAVMDMIGAMTNMVQLNAKNVDINTTYLGKLWEKMVELEEKLDKLNNNV